VIFKRFLRGMQFAAAQVRKWRTQVSPLRMIHEVLALLFPEPARAREGSVQSVLALVRDEQGLMEIKNLRPDVALIKRARVTGRVNCGKPILDPITREVMGYEIDPIVLPAA
jgi:hypothetical protein